jgi:hypothetical protein
MFLLLWGVLLTALASLVAPLAAYLVALTSGITDYEIQLRKEIRDLKKVTPHLVRYLLWIRIRSGFKRSLWIRICCPDPRSKKTEKKKFTGKKNSFFIIER